MAKNRKKTLPRAQLIRFFLKTINLNSSFEDGSKKISIRLEQEATVEVYPPSSPDKPVRSAVDIKISIAGIDEENHDVKLLTADALYQGRFLFPPEVTESEALKLIEDEEYNYILIAQVMPMAMIHLKSQLQAIGLSSQSLPIHFAG